MIQEKLEKTLNLIPKDSQIYVDVLKFGNSAASTISIRTQIDRTTVYSALNRMKNRGLITETKHNKVAYFNALAPDALKVKLEKEIQVKEKKLGDLNNIISDLSLLHTSQETRPAVQIFEGTSGVIALYELMLKTNKKQDAFLTINKMPTELKKYLCDLYIKHKRKNKVHSRVLVNDSIKAKKYKNLDKKANRKTKIIPKGAMPFETEIIIGKNEIAVIDLRGNYFGVLIKSQSICNTMSSIFNMLWDLY